jgi:hypothetical protein
VIGTPRIGIELGARTVRAVRLSSGPRGGGPRAVEIDWDRAHPQDLAASLREHLGERASGRIAVALDLPLLLVKHVKLPPLDAVEKRRVVALEPERFFAARAEDVVAVARPEDNLIFAAPEESVTAWIAALEELAPVEIVEPGPLALARAVAHAGVADAVILRDNGTDGVGLMVLRGGRIDRARRVFGGLREAARAVRDEPTPPERLFLTPWTDEGARLVASEIGGAPPEPLPDVSGVLPQFLPAFGAALAIDRPPDAVSSLAPAELTARIGGRRRRERALAIVAGLAALIFAVSSADAWRARALSRLQQELPALRDRAAPALAFQTEIQSLEQEAQTIRAIAVARPEPLRVLAALTRHVPAGAYVRSLRFAGSDWQIDGYAPSAARVLSELGGDPEFTDLHFFAATTRITLGSRTYETFALAFRFAPTH